MIRYRYIPFTFGKPKFMSKEPEQVSLEIISTGILTKMIILFNYFRQRLHLQNKSITHVLAAPSPQRISRLKR